jgi:hypothetical protein
MELASSFVIAGAADDPTAVRGRFFMFYAPFVVKNYLLGKNKSCLRKTLVVKSATSLHLSTKLR